MKIKNISETCEQFVCKRNYLQTNKNVALIHNKKIGSKESWCLLEINLGIIMVVISYEYPWTNMLKQEWAPYSLG